jgi:hypothetical protein
VEVGVGVGGVGLGVGLGTGVALGVDVGVDGEVSVGVGVGLVLGVPFGVGVGVLVDDGRDAAVAVVTATFPCSGSVECDESQADITTTTSTRTPIRFAGKVRSALVRMSRILLRSRCMDRSYYPNIRSLR